MFLEATMTTLCLWKPRVQEMQGFFTPAMLLVREGTLGKDRWVSPTIHGFGAWCRAVILDSGFALKLNLVLTCGLNHIDRGALGNQSDHTYYFAHAMYMA